MEGLAKRDRSAAPSVKVCPQCFAAMASQAKQCGECGHTFAAEVRELQQVEGELVELQRQQAKREQGGAQSLQDLIALGHQRGYKNPVGWAKHLLAARQTKGQWSKIK